MMGATHPEPLLIRELTPYDGPALQFLFNHLSQHSRWQRFMAVKPALLPVELERMTAIDHWHHEALIAFSPPPRAPVAVARYVRTHEFDLAEVAVEVRDDWQRRGVGLRLVTALRDRATLAGIVAFTATTHSVNRGALALSRAVAAPSVRAAGAGVLELRLDLDARR
jgi:acetyltransferase